MPSDALPIVLATLFTAGGIAIQKAGRYADRVGHALGVLFSVVVALLILTAATQVLPQADAPATGSGNRAGTVTSWADWGAR